MHSSGAVYLAYAQRSAENHVQLEILSTIFAWLKLSVLKRSPCATLNNRINAPNTWFLL